MDKDLEENKTIERIRVNKAFINYNDIIDKALPYKFSYLDEWLLKKSKLLKNEVKELSNSSNRSYRVYKRGTIVKVDFGVSIGSEMSQVHFAIVLSKYDNPKNNVLTVVPLTSKYSKFNLPLGTLIIDKMIDSVDSRIASIEKDDNILDKRLALNKLKALFPYYKSSVKSTYACCSLITTISKNRIFPPFNEYDIIGKERCPDEIMDKIDKDVISKLTK